MERGGWQRVQEWGVRVLVREVGFSVRRGSPLWAWRGAGWLAGWGDGEVSAGGWEARGSCEVGVEERESGRGTSAAEREGGRESVGAE